MNTILAWFDILTVHQDRVITWLNDRRTNLCNVMQTFLSKLLSIGPKAKSCLEDLAIRVWRRVSTDAFELFLTRSVIDRGGSTWPHNEGQDHDQYRQTCQHLLFLCLTNKCYICKIIRIKLWQHWPPYTYEDRSVFYILPDFCWTWTKLWYVMKHWITLNNIARQLSSTSTKLSYNSQQNLVPFYQNWEFY